MASAVYVGVDIGKSSHYALAVDAAGKPIYQTGAVNDEVALRKLVDWAREHEATVVVDQPGGGAALLLKLCWRSEVRIGYLHGLAMARAREFYAGESKTDPKDAFVLADVARAHPNRVVWLEPSSEALAHLELLCGYDADLRADANRVTNRPKLSTPPSEQFTQRRPPPGGHRLDDLPLHGGLRWRSERMRDMNTTHALNMALEALRVQLLEVQFWTGVEQTTPWALQDKPRRNKAARRAVAQSASIALEDRRSNVHGCVGFRGRS